jgi:hypothetical protein
MDTMILAILCTASHIDIKIFDRYGKYIKELNATLHGMEPIMVMSCLYRLLVCLKKPVVKYIKAIFQ